MPRVFTPESTCFRLPTSAARLCISPRPLYTCSSWVLTARKESVMRFCSASCNFSSTVPRISSNFWLLSARMVFSPCTTAPRTPSKRTALESSRFFKRVSIIVSCASMASLAAFCRAAPARSMDSSRAVFAAAVCRWFSLSTAEKSRSDDEVVRRLSPCIARSCSDKRSVSPCKTGVIAST